MNYKLIAVVLFHSTFSFPSCNVSESKINKSISSQVIEKDTSIIDSSFYQVSVIEEVKDVEIDIYQTNLADFISGKNKSYFDTILSVDEKFWNEFSDDINEDFDKIKYRRLDKMNNWS